jgi:alkanesulfonate monooxygenase SsuD/methylene tetrahydromethanopterin reductase-like flavin-dependent oxidoreductase (luciferase family)
MHVGIYLPQIGPEASQARVVETAQAAEAAGFDSLWVLDHVVLRGVRDTLSLRRKRSLTHTEFQGEFYDTAGWACHPHPPRPIPIWLGGNSKQQLRRVGQFADGWLANLAMLPTLEADFDRAREAAVRAGRSAEALQLAINRVAVLSRQDMPAAADTLMQLKERGVDHATLVVAPGKPR